eukprot:Amastigsp_a174953_33.p2 type:complete len:194 gc:universal Amastigsp_a174953_33:388-969(+)
MRRLPRRLRAPQSTVVKVDVLTRRKAPLHQQSGELGCRHRARNKSPGLVHGRVKRPLLRVCHLLADQQLHVSVQRPRRVAEAQRAPRVLGRQHGEEHVTRSLVRRVQPPARERFHREERRDVHEDKRVRGECVSKRAQGDGGQRHHRGHVERELGTKLRELARAVVSDVREAADRGGVVHNHNSAPFMCARKI